MSQKLSLLDNIQIVLVEPQGSLNVGSTCRAMKNFGLRHLAAVRPGCEMDLEAIKMAMHARDVLDSTQVCENISEATKDSVLVLGTANRRGEYHEPNYTVKESLEVIKKSLPHGKVSILFGREEWGLTREDLRHCMGTIRIMTAPENTSLNLAQAVMLVAYELYQNFGNPVALPKAKADDPLEQPATKDDLSRLYKNIASVTSMSEFLPIVNPDKVMQVIRALFHKTNPNKREINILMGVFSNIRGFMKKYVRNQKAKKSVY